MDIASSGTSATLLARRWESALLVNVDNLTLQKLLKDPEALKILQSIEGFRSLNQNIESIINKSEKVKKIKKEIANSDKELDKKPKKKLTRRRKNTRTKESRYKKN